MSDYFDALMVSSGLATAPAPKAASTATDAASDDVIEIEEVQEPDAAPTPMLHRESPAPPDLPRGAARVGEAGVSAAFANRPRDAALPPADSPPPRTAAPASDQRASSNLGHAAVRAALNWIAADPQQADGAQETRAPSSPVVAEPSARTEQRNLAGIAVEDSTTDVPKAIVRGDLVGAEAYPQIESPFSPSSPARARAKSANDEIVEVTIGAIHVHVDAPPQTIVQPVAPPAPRPAIPSWDQPAARSALSRRVLRRL